MNSMPLLEDDFNYDEINLDFLVPPLPSVATTPNACETNLKAPNFHENLSNQFEFHADKEEIKDFDLDFLESPKKEKPKPNSLKTFSTENTKNPDISRKTKNNSNINSSKILAKRIAEVDTLVRLVQAAEEEKRTSQRKLEELNNSAQEIKLLFNKEKNARIEAEKKCKTLEIQCDSLETKLASKSLELDQVQAQLEDCTGPILYSELAQRYLKLAHKLNEEHLLHWHDQPILKDITKYCKDKGHKIPKNVPRSPPKRRTSNARKTDAEIQCNLLTTTKLANEIDKSKIQKRHQSTQCDRIEMRSQGCQHIGSTITRGTTTACFFKYNDVGTNCDENNTETAFDAILEDMRTFGERYATLSPIDDETLPIVPILPLSPIPEVPAFLSNDVLPKKQTCTIGTNTTSTQNSVEYKNVGSCTYICNVQRPVDFVEQPPISIKRSNSRPPSAGLAGEAIKAELNSRSSNSSPVNFNLHAMNNPLPHINLAAPSSSSILPNTFDEIWQMFGCMLYGLLNRRILSLNGTGMGGNATFAPSNMTNQQDFNNWLHNLYNNVQNAQPNPQESSNQSIFSTASQRDTVSVFSVSNNESAASNNYSTSRISNECTPLSFSDAAPNVETVPNVIKPTALRSIIKDSKTAEAPDAYSSSPVLHKSIATSPIRCLGSTPIEFDEHLSNESALNKTVNDNIELGSITGKCKASAFKRTTIEHSEKQSTLTKIPQPKRKHYELVKRRKYLIRKLKQNKLLKKRRSKIVKETAVEFLAKLQQSEKKEENKLRQPFGSQSDADKDMEIETETDTISKGTFNNSSPKTYASIETIRKETEITNIGLNQTLLIDEDDYDEHSLLIIDDLVEKNEHEKEQCKPKANCENLAAIEDEICQNEILPCTDVKLSQTTQAGVHENKFKLNVDLPAIDSKNNIELETAKKPGRKRKVETALLSTPTEISPCKRSARLLAKQTNQKVQSNIQPKKLTLLTLDCFSTAKTSSKNSGGSGSKEINIGSEKTCKNALQSNDLIGNYENSNILSWLGKEKPACSPYSLRRGQTQTSVSTLSPKLSKTANLSLRKSPKSSPNSTKPHNVEASNQNTMLTSSNLHKDNEHASKPNTSCTANNVARNSVKFSLNNLNLTSTNISSLYKTPYALRNTATNITPTGGQIYVPEASFRPFTGRSVKNLQHNLRYPINQVDCSLDLTTTTTPINSIASSLSKVNTIDVFTTNAINANIKNVQQPIELAGSNSNNTSTKNLLTSSTNIENNSSSACSILNSFSSVPEMFMPKPNNTTLSIAPNGSRVTVPESSAIFQPGRSVKSQQKDQQNHSLPGATTTTALRISKPIMKSELNLIENSTSEPFIEARINDETHEYSKTSTENQHDFIRNEKSSKPINFDSPLASPASPTPSEMEQTQAAPLTVKEIPLQLSVTNFTTWRRWKQHKKSLLQNLISVYNPKLYTGFKRSEEITEDENKKQQQLVALINEYIKHTIDMEVSASTVELAVLYLNQKMQQITTEAKLTAQAILMSMRKQQRPKRAAYDEQHANGAPIAIIHDPLTNQTFSTHAQRCCAYFLKQLPTDILTLLLQSIENTLFDVKNADSLSLNEALNMTDLYLLVLRQQISTIKVNPARLFIAKCLYYHNLKAAPMIYAVLCAFPTVLPHREERLYDRSDALITVIQHCLMCNKYDMDNSELFHRELLSKLRFEYHFECYKPDFHEVLMNLVEKLCAGKLENWRFAFAIFCKRLSPNRVVSDVLLQHFIPLANKFYSLLEQNDAYEVRLAALLDCFSTVIKPFPRDAFSVQQPICKEIPNYWSFFERFLIMSKRPIVQEAAIHAILRLQRFDFFNCYRALAHLRLEFELQPNTKAALRTFIYRKPLDFWTKIIQQNS